MIQILLTIFFLVFFPTKMQAIYDPLTQPNNRFGIHIAGYQMTSRMPPASC